MTTLRSTLLSVLLLIISLIAAVGAAELVLRWKNSAGTNYEIEMWRYAKELKKRSDNPVLGHEHVPSRSAQLQTVEIRTNRWGMRGPEVRETRPERRILFLGSSITLGWGVPENQTITSLVTQMFKADGKDVEVLNGGIGNYNAVRYVELYETKLKELHPTDIVVNYFLRDAEILDAGGGNIFTQNSQLAVMLSVALRGLSVRGGEDALVDHYLGIHAQGAPGRVAMEKALGILAQEARSQGIRFYLALIPDVHNLGAYRLASVHQTMKEIAERLGYAFIDFLPALRSLKPSDIWALPGDPHPNTRGHRMMAQALYPVLSSQ